MLACACTKNTPITIVSVLCMNMLIMLPCSCNTPTFFVSVLCTYEHAGLCMHKTLHSNPYCIVSVLCTVYEQWNSWPVHAQNIFNTTIYFVSVLFINMLACACTKVIANGWLTPASMPLPTGNTYILANGWLIPASMLLPTGNTYIRVQQGWALRSFPFGTLRSFPF